MTRLHHGSATGSGVRTLRPMSRFARDNEDEEGQRATSLELFYDLVFVFAVTQVSHLLLDDVSWRGAGHASLCLLVVWWAWNYTTWVTNELDPDSIAVRAVLLAIMFASLVMAVAIPDAFGDRGLVFAGAYVAIQVGRHAFLTWASTPGIERERSAAVLTWLAAAGVFWIAGAFAEDEVRVAIWLLALAIDYAGPICLYRIPGRTPLSGDDWEIATTHFAERFQLFMIIALGESVVLIGATTADYELTNGRATALVLAFVMTAAMWWLYFDYVSRIAERRLELTSERTRFARDGYTYLHVVMVAGVITAAVGNELVIAHPTDELPTAEVAVVIAGPAIYLLGHVLFRFRMAGSVSWKRLGGAIGCLAVGLLGGSVPGVGLSALLVLVLVVVIVAENVAAARRRGRGEPAPLDRLQTDAG